jgi:hypothetical protein
VRSGASDCVAEWSAWRYCLTRVASSMLLITDD